MASPTPQAGASRGGPTAFRRGEGGPSRGEAVLKGQAGGERRRPRPGPHRGGTISAEFPPIQRTFPTPAHVSHTPVDNPNICT